LLAIGTLLNQPDPVRGFWGFNVRVLPIVSQGLETGLVKMKKQ
jgi:hypothetical protein